MASITWRHRNYVPKKFVTFLWPKKLSKISQNFAEGSLSIKSTESTEKQWRNDDDDND